MARESDGRGKVAMTRPSISTESSLGLKPNRRYRHGYAIVRVDDYLGAETPTERRVNVKKVVFDPDEAEREVERLNNLQGDDGSRYFLQVTRVEPTDQIQDRQETILANRISGLMPEPTADVITTEKLSKLASMIVRDSVQELLPEGWGFSALQACNVCVNHTKTDHIKWHEFHYRIYMKNYDGFVEIAGTYERQPDKHEVVFCALRVYPDLTEASIYDMMPLDILKLIADRFGLTMISGSNQGKFFIAEEFPIPKIIISGTQNGYVLIAGVPEGHAHRDAIFWSKADSVVRIPLAFAIDTTEYLRWLRNH
jgi:hypothetical protein